jgi:hypothetical protein
MTAFWSSIKEPTLHQGDLLPDCLIPEFAATFGHAPDESSTIYTDMANLIVLSQTCDLAHGKLSLAALCPVWLVPAFEEAQLALGQSRSTQWWRDYWNNVRKGRSPTLHLLASPTAPTEARSCLIVDFRAIYSLPVAYLTRRAEQIQDRWRLRSPYLEHFSQAFARSFMRVGLPSSVPEF